MNQDGFIKQHQSEFSSREEAQAKVTEIFKRVDVLLKNGEIAKAQEELKLANQTRKELMQKNQFTILKNGNCILPEPPLPPKPMDAMINSIASQKNNNTKSISSSENKNDNIKLSENSADRTYELTCYREAIIDARRKGTLTPNVLKQLSELKTILEITDTEHQLIQNEVNDILKINTVARQITEQPKQQNTHISNTVQPKTNNNLQTIQPAKQYHQDKLYNRNFKLLIIDDDVPFLKLLSSSIAEEGFETYAVPTSDQALQALRQLTPDLILCDINLKSSSMNGFIFYSRIQQYKHLQKIPFLFITGYANEEILRMVKESGADDCLTKPFTKQVLLSSIRGKLKRFQQLNNLQQKQ